MHSSALVAWFGIGLILGCAPQFDWRRVRIAATAVEVQFPCKPKTQAREVPLAGSTVSWSLQVCTVDGGTFAVGTADLADPHRTQVALRQLGDVARNNLDRAAVHADRAVSVPGSTPSQASRRIHLEGQRPDGTRITQHLVLFHHGTRLYQATVLEEQPSAEAVEIFLSSLRVVR